MAVHRGELLIDTVVERWDRERKIEGGIAHDCDERRTGCRGCLGSTG
jgi:hypothetical protein